MNITTKLGNREQLPSQLTAGQLIWTLSHMIESLQGEADRMGIDVDWAHVRIQTEEGESYSFTEGPLRAIAVRVYGAQRA